ncbi:MAG: CoA transferase [Burkholderiaceae bacterium]|nr:CoA transferase [Burkholderiaceae bacterium]
MAILDGIRVLDFGRYVAGPWCAALLGDFGAQVIRIEKRAGGEDRYVTPLTDAGEGAVLLQSGRNKLSLTLNPLSQNGREVVRRLVRSADVVVANLPPSALASMGIDYPSLVQIRPDIILATVTAYGSGGPLSEHVGFDGVAQAMSGATWWSGQPGEPSRTGVPYADFLAATNCAFGVALALMERQKTGKGQVVEASLLGSALEIANGLIMEQSVLGVNRQPSGNRSQAAAPSDIFKTRDGAIIVQVVGNGLFERLAKMLGRQDWLEDPRFATDASRGIHGDEISRVVGDWCAAHNSAELLAILDQARIPAGPVLDFQQALQHPHVQAAGFFHATDYPGLPRTAPVIDTPVRLSRTPGGIRSAAPRRGEHTDMLLAELGYSATQIAALRADKTV